MQRRCSSSACQIAAVTRTANLDLPLATVLVDPASEWRRMVASAGNRRTARDIEVDWKTYSPESHVFSHCTICASVQVEDNGYYITPASTELVNNNGNAWSNEVLVATFRSFVGADNFLEHVQVPELSKGKILDAVLRPVRYKSASGDEADVYYVDILVGTSRRHDTLCRQIQAGELNTLSMGCVCDYVTCSKCGSVLGDNDPNCECLESQMRQSFVDEKGVTRIVAELCGRTIRGKDGKLVGDPKSQRFIEASWVGHPAFGGAVLNHLVSEIPETVARVLNYPTPQLQMMVDDLFRVRVADSWGAIALKVARNELFRRRREALVDRVVQRWL